mgnify:FL=1
MRSQFGLWVVTGKPGMLLGLLVASGFNSNIDYCQTVQVCWLEGFLAGCFQLLFSFNLHSITRKCWTKQFVLNIWIESCHWEVLGVTLEFVHSGIDAVVVDDEDNCA